MSDRLNETRYVGENDSLGTLWELREIDAWVDEVGGWTWNDSFVLKRFRSDADDLKGLILKVLADVHGCPLPRGMFRVDDSDWDILEIQQRKTGMPVYAMVRLTPR